MGGLHQIENVLRSAGLLPDSWRAIGILVRHLGRAGDACRRDDGLIQPATNTDVVNLLPALLRCWNEHLGSRTSTPMAERWHEWLRDQADNHAALTLAQSPRGLSFWLGPRLIWWPHGMVPARRVAVVSSRIPRAVDQLGGWLDTLRACCQTVRLEGRTLVSARSMTTDRFLQRCSAIDASPLLSVNTTSTGELKSWTKEIVRVSRLSPRTSHQAFVSPCLTPHQQPLSHPERDCAVLGMCDQVWVLRLRRSGTTHSLIEHGLRAGLWRPGQVRLMVGPQLIAPKQASRLQKLGAEVFAGADLIRDAALPAVDADRLPSDVSPAMVFDPAPIVTVPSGADWPYLTHWTRRCNGPWPGQTLDQYLDGLLLGTDRDHSALAALTRIVRSGCLRATARLNRASARVVCWTEIPLRKLCDRRVFRPHQLRWDFEHYGICVCRQWLQSRGARPVIYGDEGCWQQLDESQRPFFQLRMSRGRKLDWTAEREWRSVGDVDLSRIPSSKALVYVPSRAEAEQIARISPWPVVMLER